jgi:hypothetical protein
MLIDIDIQKLKNLSKGLKDISEEFGIELTTTKNKSLETDKPILRDLNSVIKGAPNFTYGEFIKSDTAKRLHIENIPNENEWFNIELLATQVLQPIRQKFGKLRITSGFRCLELNTAIGSSKSSSHVKGEAADFEPIEENILFLDIIEFIYTKLEFRELILEYGLDGWIHVSYRKNANLKKLKLKDKNHNYALVNLDYLHKIYG